MDFINIVNVNLVVRVKTGILRHVSRAILRRIVAPPAKNRRIPAFTLPCSGEHLGSEGGVRCFLYPLPRGGAQPVQNESTAGRSPTFHGQFPQGGKGRKRRGMITG